MDIVSKGINRLRNVLFLRFGIGIDFHLFLSMIVLLWLFVGCFVYYQYHREKEFKVNLLTTQLKQLNDEIAFRAQQDSSIYLRDLYVYEHNSQLQHLRVTILDSAGNVLQDNVDPQTRHFSNHRERHEIKEALLHGMGFTIRRNSATLGNDYFYVACYYPDKQILVRSALPYDVRLVYGLKVDRGFLWFSICVACVLTLAFYRQTRVLMQTIYRLQEEEKSRLKHQLSMNMSHELKTPVASIQGYVETVLENPTMDEHQRTLFLERCHIQTKRLTNLLRDINLLNRMDEAPHQMEKVHIDLNTLIKGIAQDVHLSMKQREMKVILQLPTEMPFCGNEGLLYSIFRNLFDNSIAYAGEGTTIFLRGAEKERGKWHFQFSDNGTGVSDEHLSSLFNRFYRVDKGRSRRLGGTGLGLAIVKNAVQFHGGNIVVQHASPHGLLFDFTLCSSIDEY